MGLDGGTYITRSDVLRGQSWELAQADTSRSTRGGSVQPSHVHKRRKLDARAEKLTRWTTCALTGEPLAPPVVADYLGALYNKAAVLEFLLARAGAIQDAEGGYRYLNQLREAGGAFDHITCTRDVFEVRLGGDSAAAGPASPQVEGAVPLACPITDLPCDRYPFVALPGCGHVFSERAVKEIRDGTCALCGAAFQQAEVVPLCGPAEQVEQLRAALPQRRASRDKPGKKKRKREGGLGATAAAGDGNDGGGGGGGGGQQQ